MVNFSDPVRAAQDFCAYSSKSLSVSRSLALTDLSVFHSDGCEVLAHCRRLIYVRLLLCHSDGSLWVPRGLPLYSQLGIYHYPRL